MMSWCELQEALAALSLRPAVCSSHGFPLGPASLIACNFLQQMFLASPTSWSLYCNLSFTLTNSHISLSEDACRDPDPATHCLISQAFMWTFWWKPPWPHKSCILHACKVSIIWMMLRSTTSLSSIWVPVDLACSGFWVSRCWKETSLCGFMQAGHLSSSLLSQSLSNKFTILDLGALNEWSLANFWDALKALFLLSPCKVLGFFLMVLISLTIILCPWLSIHSFSTQTAQFSNLSTLLFASDSHYKSG
jgi:hypothetical protein